MRFHTYSKFSRKSADAVDLQALLDNLADFLLQSGFAGGGSSNPWGGDDLDQGGQFTPEMLEALRSAAASIVRPATPGRCVGIAGRATRW